MNDRPLIPAARRPGADPHVIEARFAHRVAARLDDALGALPADVEARLRFAREQAVARARAAQRERQAASPHVAFGGGVAARRGGPSAWLRAAAWVPLLLVVAGLWAIDQHQAQRRAQTVAELDARLLTDVLPPQAYADPGFEAFLAHGAAR